MQTVCIDGLHYDLAAIEKNCWQRIINGSLQKRNAFQTPVVANAGASGINMRTVVLREAGAAKKQLSFYTDNRSGKWAELQRNNRISWLFYDPLDRIQIRAGGIAALHHNDELADKAWSGTSITNRKNYLSEPAPSTETEHPVSGLPTEFEQADPTAEQTEAGRKNFGLVITSIQWMEWLWLNNSCHRRAVFVYNEKESFTANWLVP
ncbi:MAG: pyridoxamine 5'-phosphate oxidase family protein [Ferruginibacter sp.]|nr:pyridoxamine 5'-phosphate oxidase family protein [Ferruginibacter sp.]